MLIVNGMDDALLQKRARARFVVIALLVVVAGLAGYWGFVGFVGSGGPNTSTTFVLAAATGFAAFFSPCSFPLMLTFLARRTEESTRRALASALRVGLGAVTLLLSVGVAMALAGTAVGSVVTFDSAPGRVFRATVGVVLIALGLKQAGVVNWRMTWFDSVAAATAGWTDQSRSSNRFRKDFMYGFGYLLAGFG